MLEENKNLKDPERKPSASYGAGPSNVSVTLSYTKTNKLITALYMVTDIMDKEEPIRNKLRELGIQILSDTSITRSNLVKTAEKILSLLDIVSTMNMISEMNCDILKKEFTELKNSFNNFNNIDKENTKWLEEFMFEPPLLDKSAGMNIRSDGEVSGLPAQAGGGNSKNHHLAFSGTPPQKVGDNKYTSIGVQKGSTLLKALKNVSMSDRNNNNFDVLKNKRREEILKIIKSSPSSGATITNIKEMSKGVLVSCGDKTLQRELISMVKDGVLKKVGEKRWSKYFL